MGYGIEEDHLEAKNADIALGDLQGSVVGSKDFMRKLSDYISISETRSFLPTFTLITADKDDPRFDEFYKKGNLLRFFIGLLFQAMPSYFSLGFEFRNLHETRAANVEYSKLNVFQITDDDEKDKVTHGPFIREENMEKFLEFEKLKRLSQDILPLVSGKTIKWLSETKNYLMT